jgi:hypothetical protein
LGARLAGPVGRRAEQLAGVTSDVQRYPTTSIIRVTLVGGSEIELSALSIERVIEQPEGAILHQTGSRSATGARETIVLTVEESAAEIRRRIHDATDG